MEKETQDKWVVYQRCYDNPKRENGEQKRNLLLGIFEPFKIIHDDTYTSLRYGIKDGSLYRIDEFEVSGYDGGSKFEVTPITTCEDVKVYCEWQSMQKGLTMTHEQKPFEIKEWDVIPENQMPAYVSDANAEIRRLQEELEESEETSKDKDEAIAGLNQQLAAAPSWGDWQEVKGELKISAGCHDVEFDDGSTELHTAADLRYMLTRHPTKIVDEKLIQNKVKQFRRLNYKPQPAREVEKTYWGKTIKELVNDYSDSYEGELARDLLAVQAELRELKGER